jgi:hypothetical protein
MSLLQYTGLISAHTATGELYGISLADQGRSEFFEAKGAKNANLFFFAEARSS